MQQKLRNFRSDEGKMHRKCYFQIIIAELESLSKNHFFPFNETDNYIRIAECIVERL